MVGDAFAPEVLALGLRFPEGPVQHPDGSVWCVELHGGALVRRDATGELTRTVVGGAPNGLMHHPGDGLMHHPGDGTMWFCDADAGVVRALGSQGDVVDRVRAPDGGELSRPNDLARDGAGNVVVSCPGQSRQQPDGYVVCRSVAGEVHVVADGLQFPNGVAFSPDDTWLYVAETYRRRIWRGRWSPAAGTWTEPEVMVSDLPGAPGPDGLAVAEDGTVLVALFGVGLLAVLDPNGWLRRTVTVPGSRPTNVAVDLAGDLLVTEAENGLLLRFPRSVIAVTAARPSGGAGRYPHVPLDPEVEVGLAGLGQDRPPTSVTPDMIPARRAATAGLSPAPDDLDAMGLHVHRHEAHTTGDAAPVPLLLCRPEWADSSAPVLYCVHGGGMFTGSATSALRWAAPLAARIGAALVSVDYRLAPEDPDPAPGLDVYAGLRWTCGESVRLGLDPARLVVVGVSAGGGLAAGAVLRSRDRGDQQPAGLMLVGPMLDDRNDSFSGHQMLGRGVWDRTANETGWSALLGDARAAETVSPYTAPARADDLAGLPPVFLDVGSAETFRDETVAFADRIWRAGGDAELHVWPGGIHGFDSSVPSARLSQDAVAARVAWLRRRFAR